MRIRNLFRRPVIIQAEPSGEYIKEPKPDYADWRYPDIEHWNGVPWMEAPIPNALTHKCRPQTLGWVGFNYVERCACGAIRMDPSDPWMERNSRTSESRQYDTPYMERKQAEIDRHNELLRLYPPSS